MFDVVFNMWEKMKSFQIIMILKKGTKTKNKCKI